MSPTFIFDAMMCLMQQEKPKQRPTRFGLCTKRNIACFIILGIVVGAVGTAVYHKDKATESKPPPSELA